MSIGVKISSRDIVNIVIKHCAIMAIAYDVNL
ncbi:hypothetical protein ZONE111905_19875 [Zobellia nedashkovskayae]